MNGLLKKALTVMLSMTVLTSTIPAGSISTVSAQGYDETKGGYNGAWVEKLTDGRRDAGELEVAIGSAADWNAWAANADFNDAKTIVLTADIEFTEETPNATLPSLAATLVGNGYTITGVTNPLIATLNGGATVENLKIEGADISASYDNVAVLANQAILSADISVTNVVIDANIASTVGRASGLICYVVTNADTTTGTKLTLTNCTVSGTVDAVYAEINVGGGAGLVANVVTGKDLTVAPTVVLNNCKNSANITVTDTTIKDKTCRVGGLVAYVTGDVTAENCENAGAVTMDAKTSHVQLAGIIEKGNVVTLTNCTNSGRISSTAQSNKNAYLGGLLNSPVASATITNCLNTGDVIANSSSGGNVMAGGICSITGEIPFTAIDCINRGDVKAEDAAGGIVGRPRGDATITNCVNMGNIEATGGPAGGLVGNHDKSYDIGITSSANTGAVSSATVGAGGILGIVSAKATITDCVNTGTVSSCVNANGEFTQPSGTDTRNAGGILGYTNAAGAAGSTITNCINTGTVMAPRNAGGIMGLGKTGSATVTIDGCSNSGELISRREVGGIIGYSNAAITVTNCQVTGTVALKGVTETQDATMAVIAANSNTTVTNCIGCVDMGLINDQNEKDFSKVAWIDAEVTTDALAAYQAKVAVWNLEVQKSATDANGRYTLVVLAGMNDLDDLVTVGFDVIRVVDGKITTDINTEGDTIYSSVMGYVEGVETKVTANEKDVTYLSALEIYNVSKDENVTYIYRAYAKDADGNKYYGTWSSVTYDAVA